MTTDTSKITTTEDFRDKTGDGPVFTHTPDFQNTVMADMAEFIWKASEALSAFRQRWRAEHEGEWSQSLEMDIIPVMTDGMISGYMVISENTGDAYDFAPTKVVEAEQ